jgi:hypothetical protein
LHAQCNHPEMPIKADDRRLIDSIRARAIKPGMKVVSWQHDGREVKAYLTQFELLRLKTMAANAGLTVSQLLSGTDSDSAKR